MAREISISVDEWEAARRASMVVGEDEREPTGQVRLRSDGVRRVWTATDRVRGVVVVGGPDPDVYDVGVSPAMLEHAVLTSDEDGPGPSLIFTEMDGRDYLVASGPGGALWHAQLDHDLPDLESFIAADDTIEGRAAVIVSDLYFALHAAGRAREGVDGDGDRGAPFWMAVDGRDLLIGADWDECGRSLVVVPAVGVVGEVVVELDPELLRSVLDQFRPGTRIDVRIPRSNLLPVLFSTDACTAMLMPMSTPARRLRGTVEALLKETFGDLALDRDDNGDYLLTRRRVPVRGRLLAEAEPPVFTLSSTVVADVEPSADLLRELNDVNAQTSFASVVWIDGAVVASVDLMASTVDPDELVVAARRIHQLALEVAPTIAVVLGGNVVEDPEAARFSLYRRTVIEAEVVPGRTDAITGPGGLADWPFPGTVHVITGYNPQGVRRDDETNEAINRAIAVDVLERGGRFVHGAGAAVDGSYVEPSLIVWGIGRGDATAMGWRADQDAVFEIDADEMRLISCVDDRVVAWPRLGPPPV